MPETILKSRSEKVEERKIFSAEDLMRIVGEGKTLGEVRKIPEELREFIYLYGKDCFQRGQEEKAEDAFRFLALNFHKEPDFWEALGNVALGRRNYPLAQGALTMCFILRPTVYHGCRLMRADGIAGEPSRSLHIMPHLMSMALKQGKSSLGMLNAQWKKQRQWLEWEKGKQESTVS